MYQEKEKRSETTIGKESNSSSHLESFSFLFFSPVTVGGWSVLPELTPAHHVRADLPHWRTPLSANEQPEQNKKKKRVSGVREHFTVIRPHMKRRGNILKKKRQQNHSMFGSYDESRRHEYMHIYISLPSSLSHPSFLICKIEHFIFVAAVAAVST
jgi:hypothetical protein